MNKETIALRAKLIADLNVFSLEKAVGHLNNDFSEETLNAVLGRSDFSWIEFFTYINTDVAEFELRHHGLLLQKLEVTDIMILIKISTVKDLNQIWKIIIKRKNEIPFEESHEFVLRLSECEMIKSGESYESFDKILKDYFGGLSDTSVAIELAKKIESDSAKVILLKCGGTLTRIKNMPAKSAVELGIVFGLFGLWNELLYSDEVIAYIKDEMKTSEIPQVFSANNVMYYHCLGDKYVMSDVIAFAKKTNSKLSWQFVLEKETNPKVLLSLFPFLPENYLKAELMKKQSLVAYISSLRYGSVVGLLEKVDDADFFTFILKNSTAKVSAVKIVHFANKFCGQDKPWNYLVQRDDIRKLYMPFLSKNADIISFQAQRHQSKSFWNFAITESRIEVATEIAIKRDSADSWKALLTRPDFDKDNLSLLLSMYSSSNNPEVWDMVLSFECVKNYCDKQ